MQIGVNARARVGEKICGDAHAISRSGISTTIAVVDGLGHGEKAAEASQAFCDFTEQNLELPLEGLMRGAHRELKATRGAAAVLLRIDEEARSLAFLGVGNVALTANSIERIRPISNPGIVGKRLSKLIGFDYPVHPDDMIVVYSDGVSGSFPIERFKNLPAQAAADAIARDHGKFHDDVTCLVIRF